MEVPYFIECILKERKITELLSSRGIFPVRENGDKLLYKCPVHDGDNDPSFTVFTGEEYENYYCFGCHSGITVINLLSDLDKISIKESVKKLAHGLDIDEKDILLSSVRDTEKFLEEGGVSRIKEVEELSLKINRACYEYLLSTNFNKEEVKFFIKIYKKIDILTRRKDFKNLKRLYSFIIDEGIPYKVKQYHEKEEKMFIERGSKVIC
jgi:DNA primase